ncbi:hypothetical protein LR48_Vigan484s000800 [Vigna angularis]|uniref:Uncharacterized protein n=1 Tax=Phaseolus angularis TaxID=3914 RepID=A0A0L9TBY6_PHAAN|nr:hypothetical protein LR48_Vigan484s000800 [Vigna angularis]
MKEHGVSIPRATKKKKKCSCWRAKKKRRRRGSDRRQPWRRPVMLAGALAGAVAELAWEAIHEGEFLPRARRREGGVLGCRWLREQTRSRKRWLSLSRWLRRARREGSGAAEEVVARKLARRSGDAVTGGSGGEDARQKREGDPGFQ